MEKIVQMYTGRLERMQWFLLNMLLGFMYLGLVFLLIPEYALKAIMSGQDVLPPLYFSVPLFVLGAVFWWHLDVRRLHDMGFSGWWLVPIIVCGYLPAVVGVPLTLVFALALALLFWPGTSGDNAYGVPARSGRGLFAAFLNR